MEMGFYNFNQGIASSYHHPSSNTITTTTTTTNNNTSNFGENYGCLPTSSSMAYPPPHFDALLQKHNNELDHYLHFQAERLKEAINQQKRQQMLLLARSYESKSMALLKEKEEILEKLRVKSELLEEYLKKAEQESEVWQNLAKEKQQMVIGLNNMLLLAQQNNTINNNDNNINYINYNNNDDAESVCDCGSPKKRSEEEIEKNNDKKKISSCKWCKNEIMSVVLLPCKHLCCCKSCEPFLGLCPICLCIKQGSMEIFFS